jgi:hypothetical protein
MGNWNHMIVLETDEDVDKFLKEWKDKPKGKKKRRCKCGAELARWRHKCDKCIRAGRRELNRDYMRAYMRKYRAKLAIDATG